MRNSTLYVVAGPKTFRLGSRKILHKWGGNMQNIEKSMREIYHPDEGKIFVQVDQSGAEALIVAYCCEPGQYRELFINKVKPHTYLAMQLFKEVWPRKMRENNIITADSGFDIDDVIRTPIPALKRHPFWKDLDLIIKDSDNWPLTERYYYLAKQTEHSSNYNVGPATFRMNVLEKSGGKVVISKEDAERFLATKFKLFPEIQGYHKWVEQLARQGKILYNLHGHPYQITHYEILESHLRELYSWIPQSTVGEITHIAYTKMYHYIQQQKLRWDLLANTHDSYLLQCPIGEEVECAKKASEFMNQSFVSPIDGAEFSMRSEAQCGFNWSPAKKNKNLEGLREIQI